MSCPEVFGGTFTFERHRIGAIGIRVGPRRRRCMTPTEMIAAGLHLGPRGWSRTFQMGPRTLQVQAFEPRSAA